MPPEPGVTGRCYCGAVSLSAPSRPEIVTYCHCVDCKRWTGAPAPAFAAFSRNALALAPSPDPVSHANGVARWFCPACGSALATTFDYLPDQVYVPLGVLDQAAGLAPQMHCHSENMFPWLHPGDGLERTTGSGRAVLNAAGETGR